MTVLLGGVCQSYFRTSTLHKSGNKMKMKTVIYLVGKHALTSTHPISSQRFHPWVQFFKKFFRNCSL